MLYRTMLDADLDLILPCFDQPSVDTTTRDRFLAYQRKGSYRPAWTWLAVTGDELSGLAVWWGFPTGDRPLALDFLWAAPSITDPIPMWAGLIGQVPPPAGYHIFTIPSNRDDPAIALRLAAAAAAGLTTLNERFRYEWTPSTPLPPRSTRLSFRPAPDEAFVDAFEQISFGSLDIATREGTARQGARAQAEEDVDDYRRMPGPRDQWRLAYDNAGTLIGCALPSANDGGPVVGYLGVLPSHRGHGYAADLLAEITWMLAESGATSIRADTDSTNTPMVTTFDGAGYRRFALRLVASHPATT
ncbi:GNAT family N-acetyltransferase [Actinoplanes bogorensis]|uniref:GNAT family N-acetyltransferase n=1 Tax=Paractinoplanes bogorensis TaxID=1610840 RepID=A0ABS5YP58_9ACTN|nr:GNAT family N-acetyltransferase [Actinoplanes bogorensis]MBU2665247.1 GNAT family N-acetyltransferase [Actinoplanes bogorensis]